MTGMLCMALFACLILRNLWIRKESKNHDETSVGRILFLHMIRIVGEIRLSIG